MDAGVHWGVLRNLRQEVGANPAVLVTAIVLDIVVLVAFVGMKAQSDPLIVVFAILGLIAVFAGEWLYLRSR